MSSFVQENILTIKWSKHQNIPLIKLETFKYFILAKASSCVGIHNTLKQHFPNQAAHENLQGMLANTGSNYQVPLTYTLKKYIYFHPHFPFYSPLSQVTIPMYLSYSFSFVFCSHKMCIVILLSKLFLCKWYWITDLSQTYTVYFFHSLFLFRIIFKITSDCYVFILLPYF
jgi:hypothetical protein